MKKQKELTIPKPNMLTEAKTGLLRVFDDKLINILYFLIMNHIMNNPEDDILSINLLEIKKLLGIKSNDYIELILQSLERLENRKITLRNINYKGKDIEWIRTSVIKEMIIYSDNRSNLKIEISRVLLEGLKQKNSFTPLDINICNQFKTKYGLKLYELYKRYENFSTNHSLMLKENESCFLISTNDATERFGNSFTYPSKWQEAFRRGLEEIKTITNIDINMCYIKQEKMFLFYWTRTDINQDFKAFKKYMRKHFINKTIVRHTQNNGLQVELSISPDGRLYNKLNTQAIPTKSAKELWIWLFNNQSKWRTKI